MGSKYAASSALVFNRFSTIKDPALRPIVEDDADSLGITSPADAQIRIDRKASLIDGRRVVSLGILDGSGQGPTH